MKILWTIGYYGKYTDDHPYIELDGKTFLSQKINGMYHHLMEYFDELKQHDIYCEIIPLIEKGWLTPKGGLRKNGWKVRLKFSDKLNETDTLNLLMEYISKLATNYGKNAFKSFNRADLSIMTN